LQAVAAVVVQPQEVHQVAVAVLVVLEQTQVFLLLQVQQLL
jgi:hypothetical protein